MFRSPLLAYWMSGALLPTFMVEPYAAWPTRRFANCTKAPAAVDPR
jgi:hypothetical protein